MSAFVKPVLTTAEYQALLVGLPKYCPNAVFTLSSQNYTTPQVVALINNILNAALAIPPARATWLSLVAAHRAAETEDGATVKEVREVVTLMFKNVPATLADLAIVPRKAPKPLSAEARAAASAKAKATRLARGTGSKKQKALVTGNVTGVNITPVTTPSPSPTATPAATPATTPAVGAGAGAPVGGNTPHS